LEARITALGTLFQSLINEIATQLKTITQLNDDAEGTRVFKWEARHLPIPGRYNVEVKAGPMEVIGGLTMHSTKNEFTIICDLLYFADAEGQEGAFLNAMAVAEKIYDQFHLTTINGLVFKALVSIVPGDGELSSKNMLAIPIRVIIRCEKDVRR
jgi:hypothetical protein